MTDKYKELLNKSEMRLHEVAVHCERVERRLKDVNTAAMNLTRDLVCMECDNDDRLDRDREMERIMQWRNEWDKAMHNNQLQMQPCAGRNCGSTNPNLHSAECFEDYANSTGADSNRTWTQAHWTEYEHSIVAAEREAIAQSLDKQADLACDEIDRQWAQEMAAAVRARGQA